MVDFAKLLRDGPPPIPKVPRLVIAVTGHRPDKLPDRVSGYDRDNPLRVALRLRMRAATERLVAAPPPEVVDRFRASHLDSYLRQVRWREGVERPLGVLGLTGCALGVDQDMAGVWARMGIPYVACVPFEGQDSRWPKQSRDVYAAVLAHAAGVVLVSPTRPRDDAEAGRMLLRRNEWMCDAADELVAVHDGSRGGTSHCLRYFQIGGKRAVVIDPREVALTLPPH